MGTRDTLLLGTKLRAGFKLARLSGLTLILSALLVGLMVSRGIGVLGVKASQVLRERSDLGLLATPAFRLGLYGLGESVSFQDVLGAELDQLDRWRDLHARGWNPDGISSLDWVRFEGLSEALWRAYNSQAQESARPLLGELRAALIKLSNQSAYHNEQTSTRLLDWYIASL